MSENGLQHVTDGRRRRLLPPTEQPAYALSLLLIAAFGVELLTGGAGRWGLSAQAIREGRFETILTHMLSHAGVIHLLMNLMALGTFSAMVVPRLGRGLRRWRRYGVLFLGSGLAGAAMFLVLDPLGRTPMVGASGAICGLWGAASRMLPDEPGLLPLRSPPVRRAAWSFLVSNAVLFTIIFLAVAASGGLGGLAWQAHLGGYLFGLLGIRWFVEAPPAGPWGARV
jgi:membrane associated rhomboid family serine protease